MCNKCDEAAEKESISSAIKFVTEVINRDTKEWWKDLATGKSVLEYEPSVLQMWIATKLMLSVSELAEAMEGLRKDQMDDKLPHRKMLEVELADCVIRCLDLGGGLGLDVSGALAEKLEFNRNRADFKPENRKAKGGKSI